MKPLVRHRWRRQTSRAVAVGDGLELKGYVMPALRDLLAVRDVRRGAQRRTYRGAGVTRRGSQRSSSYQYELVLVPQYATVLFPLLRSLKLKGPTDIHMRYK